VYLIQPIDKPIDAISRDQRRLKGVSRDAIDNNIILRESCDCENSAE